MEALQSRVPESIEAMSFEEFMGTPAAGPRLSAVELALELWMSCAPQGGYWLEESHLHDLLPNIAGRVSGYCASTSSAGGGSQPSRDLADLFCRRSPQEKPLFMQLLKVHEGQIHFLYFWRASGEILRLSGLSDPEEEDSVLTNELDTMRDRLLRRLEESGGGRGETPRPIVAWGLATTEVLAEAQRAKNISAHPSFWEVIVASIQRHDVEELAIEELTGVLLEWLRCVPMWEETFGSISCAGGKSQTAGARSGSRGAGLPVKLHIYDVSQEESVRKINRILAHKMAPLKLGGVFHAGVEVNDLEWSFGYSPSETKYGVSCVKPKTNPQHHYRQTVTLKPTRATPEEISEIISAMIEEYPGDDYDLLRRNCCHFADDFSRRLGVGGIPGWVHRLARLGAGIDNILHTIGRSPLD